MKIREVSEQQINAALSDLERKVDSKDSLKQVNSDWNSTTGVSQILNKPKLAAVATSGDYNDLTNKPHIPGGSIVNSVNGMTGTVELHASDVGALPDSTVIPAAQVNSDWNATSGVSEILNKPSLATVATSGDYNDLTNTPTIPTIPVDSVNGKTGVVVLDATDVSALPDNTHIPDDPVQADWNETDNTKLDYIKNKPTIDTTVTSGSSNAVSSDAVYTAIAQSIKRKWTETRPYHTGSSASNIKWTCIETYGGLKVCFGRATSVRSSVAIGNIYYSSGTDESWEYPVGMFSAEPTCIMQVSSNGSWIFATTQAKGTSTYTKLVCPACPTDFGQNRTMEYDIVAFGV